MMLGQMTRLAADPVCATNTCKNMDTVFDCVNNWTLYYQYLDCFYCAPGINSSCDNGTAGVACNITTIDQQSASSTANDKTCPCSTYRFVEAPFVAQSSWNPDNFKVRRCAFGPQ